MTDKSVKPSALALLPFLENMNMMSKSFFALACATLTFVTIGAPVEWTFPRTGCCHEGIPFSDGVTGVLVWGGGDTINLTVGRADLWDHRGGYPWTDEQSYTNIVAAVESGDTKRLLGLFRKETPKGEPCNPYMLPLGRVVVKLQGGATLARGELDPFTGFGKLILSDGKAIELAMSKKSRAFAMRAVGGDVPYGVSVRHCMEFPSAKEALEAVGFEKAKPWADADVEGPAGFVWKLPADQQVALAYQKRLSGEFVLKTARGDVTELNGRIKRVGSFAQILAESVDHWTKFWETGARIKVPEPVLQRVFDFGMYRFGAMTDPEGVPAGLQGAWLEDDRLVPWNGDYHFNINVQQCYSPAYRGGHFEHLKPLFKMILGWRPRLRDNAKKFAGIDDGYVLPHSVDDRGVCIGGFWTGTIDHASTAWMASFMFRYVKYARDLAFLKSDAYDFMKGAMNVYRAMMEERDGRLSFPLAPSPEWGGANPKGSVGRDPSFQLAACHRLAKDLIAAAEMLGEKPDSMWLDVEKRLPAYTADESGFLLFEGQPFVESHRHHSHMAGLYPFDTIDLGKAAARKAANATYDTWVMKGTGLWSGWSVPWASILHTHFGHADAAADKLRAWDRYYTNPGHGSCYDAQAPGFSVLTGSDIMQMDGQCAAVTAVMEMMAHEVNGKVEFFRGCPESWKEVSFENIRLSDGTSVSGSRINGVVKTSVH